MHCLGIIIEQVADALMLHLGPCACCNAACTLGREANLHTRCNPYAASVRLKYPDSIVRDRDYVTGATSDICKRSPLQPAKPAACVPSALHNLLCRNMLSHQP